MTDEPEDRPHQPFNRRRDGRPEYDSWDQRPNVMSIFSRLGYNLYNEEDVNRLRENLRFAEEGRRKSERFESNRLGWIVGVIIAAFSAVLTALGQVIATHFSK